MEPLESKEGGLLEPFRRMLDTALDLIQTRLQLLSIELQEEKLRLAGVLFRLAVCSVFAILTLASATAFAVYLLWEFSPAAALGGMAAAYAAMTTVLVMRLKSYCQQAPRLFGGTLAELEKDRECLKRGN